MPKEETIIKDARVKFKGTFDFEQIYLKLRQWLLDKGYSDPCKEGEEKYAEKIRPNGKQVEIIWKTSKFEDSGFLKFEIQIIFFILGLSEAEGDYDGKKIKMDKGEAEILFSGTLVENADGAWDEHSLMYKLYKKMVLEDNIELGKIEVYKDVNALVDELKNFFNLYRL